MVLLLLSKTGGIGAFDLMTGFKNMTSCSPMVEKQLYHPGGHKSNGPSSPLPYDVRFLPVSRYSLELPSGVWVLECGVLTSREA